MGLIFIYELNENNPYTSDPSHMQKSPHSIRNGHFNGNHKRAFTSFNKSGLEKIKNNKTEFQVSAPVGCRCIYINLRLSHSLLPRITTPLHPIHCKLSSSWCALVCTFAPTKDHLTILPSPFSRPPLKQKRNREELSLFSHPWQRFVSPQLSFFFFLSYVLSKFPVSFIHSSSHNFFCNHTQKTNIFASLVVNYFWWLIHVFLYFTRISIFFGNFFFDLGFVF